MSRTARRPYTGAKAVSGACRRGSCPWCAGGRRHAPRRRRPADEAEQVRASEAALARSRATS